MWTIIPAGEYIASAAASAILWLVLMNSTLKSPRVTAVSYTHLDVYKRQLLNNCKIILARIVLPSKSIRTLMHI